MTTKFIQQSKGSSGSIFEKYKITIIGGAIFLVVAILLFSL